MDPTPDHHDDENDDDDDYDGDDDAKSPFQYFQANNFDNFSISNLSPAASRHPGDREESVQACS